MILLDIAVLAVIYIAVLLAKWQYKGKKTIILNTVVYLYICALLFFTLMPIIGNIPNIFKGDYKPMSLIPFRDIINGYDGSLRQVLLNILLTLPFGFLIPLISKNKSIFKTLLITFSVSLIIEILQPFGGRTSDITDIITNCIGGLTGYVIYLVARKIYRKIKK